MIHANTGPTQDNKRVRYKFNTRETLNSSKAFYTSWINYLTLKTPNNVESLVKNSFALFHPGAIHAQCSPPIRLFGYKQCLYIGYGLQVLIPAFVVVLKFFIHIRNPLMQIFYF